MQNKFIIGSNARKKHNRTKNKKDKKKLDTVVNCDSVVIAAIRTDRISFVLITLMLCTDFGLIGFKCIYPMIAGKKFSFDLAKNEFANRIVIDGVIY